jgi:hypothetical protein
MSEYDVQIAKDLSDGVKEIIRPLPIADKKTELLRLARLSREAQEAIANQLASGGANSVQAAQQVLNVDAVAPGPTSPRRKHRPRPVEAEMAHEDRTRLLDTVVAHFQQSSAITASQIAGRPAAEVMAERLAALPQPELVLIKALVVGQVQEAAASWVAAVRADVQHGVFPFDAGLQLDSHSDATSTPEARIAAGYDPAETSSLPDVAAHPLMGDAAYRDGQRKGAAVMAVRGDDDADIKGEEVGDQLPFQWHGEGAPPHEHVLLVQEEEKQPTQKPPIAPSRPPQTADRKGSPVRPRARRSKAEVSAALTGGEPPATVPGVSVSNLTALSDHVSVTDPVELGSPHVQTAGHLATPATPDDRCGWCGSTRLWHADTGSGRIHCEVCHAVYNPRKGCWNPGERDKEQRPPGSVPVANSSIEGEIGRGPSKAMASSTARGGAFGNTVAAAQTPPAQSHGDGKTHLRKCRQIA